jgi:ornithine carbamoyltransferase
MTDSVKHFLTLMDVPADELRQLIQHAVELKQMHYRGEIHEHLKHKVLGMVFEKSSTRTRVSFEAGMTQFGGSSIFLSPRDTQLGRGEPIEDSARVLSRMVDIIMIRTYEHEKVETFARYSRVPVINALTDMYHPCQLLADMQTYLEHRGNIQGKKVVFVGDGNNMCHSYMNAARQFDFQLNIACPEGYEPNARLLQDCSSHCQIVHDPMAAAVGADLVVTDVWASMGQEEEMQHRREAFSVYQVNEQLMAQADKQAIFMHCLPAHRGEEVTSEVLEGPQSVVWDEAENRLHAQKALLKYLFS